MVKKALTVAANRWSLVTAFLPSDSLLLISALTTRRAAAGHS
jgi:hypothetical protein